MLYNSINYTLKNGIIDIVISNSKNMLQISVTDNGIGISEQNKCKLFNSFRVLVVLVLFKISMPCGLCMPRSTIDRQGEDLWLLYSVQARISGIRQQASHHTSHLGSKPSDQARCSVGLRPRSSSSHTGDHTVSKTAIRPYGSLFVVSRAPLYI